VERGVAVVGWLLEVLEIHHIILIYQINKNYSESNNLNLFTIE